MAESNKTFSGNKVALVIFLILSLIFAIVTYLGFAKPQIINDILYPYGNPISPGWQGLDIIVITLIALLLFIASAAISLVLATSQVLRKPKANQQIK